MDDFEGWQLGFPHETIIRRDSCAFYLAIPAPEHPHIAAGVWYVTEPPPYEVGLFTRPISLPFNTPISDAQFIDGYSQFEGAGRTVESPMHACALIHHLVEQYRATRGGNDG